MGAGRHPARCFLYGRVSFVVTRLLLIALPSKVCTLMASLRSVLALINDAVPSWRCGNIFSAVCYTHRGLLVLYHKVVIHLTPPAAVINSSTPTLSFEPRSPSKIKIDQILRSPMKICVGIFISECEISCGRIMNNNEYRRVWRGGRAPVSHHVGSEFNTA
jgi:hypothetical protein